MAYYPREQIRPKCDGKKFHNGICMHCGHNYIGNFLEPVGWLVDNHPVVFWGLLIGALVAFIYLGSIGAFE